MTFSKKLRPGSAISIALAGGLLFFAINSVGNVSAFDGESNRAEKIPNQYIVILNNSAGEAELKATKEDVKSKGAELIHVYKYAIKGFAIKVPNDQVLQIIQRNNPNIAYIEQDQTVQSFAKRPPTTVTSQMLPKGVNRVDGDLSSTKSGDGTGAKVDVDIAIIDTGIDLTHPDLNVYRNVGFVSGTPGGNDDGGHGTHVAGIAAALDNSIGAVGIAPGARLWAIKVLDSRGSGSMSNVVKGVDYATQHANEIDVVNMSLGCSCSSGALENAIAKSVAAGITYVVAAGNAHTNASTFTPANHPDAITVSAIVDSDGKCGASGSATSYGADDTFATFSNYGSVVDIAAPGVKVYSTYKAGSYAYMSGTSMASPHVAGSAALYASSHPAASPSDIRSALLSGGSVRTTACDGNGHGYFDFSADLDSIREPLLYAKNY